MGSGQWDECGGEENFEEFRIINKKKTEAIFEEDGGFRTRKAAK